MHVHVAAEIPSERILLPFSFVRLPSCFGWVFLGVGGGGLRVWVWWVCACAALLVVLSVRNLGLASNSFIDSFLLDSP